MEDQGLAIKHEDQGQRIMQSPARLATARRRLRGLAWGLQWEIMEDLQRSRYIQLSWGEIWQKADGWLNSRQKENRDWWSINHQKNQLYTINNIESLARFSVISMDDKNHLIRQLLLRWWVSWHQRIVQRLSFSLKRYWVPKQIQVGCCCWPCVHLNAKKPDPNK